MLKNAFFSIYNISEHYFSAYFAQKQTMEKILIFDQNHGLTPLQKFEFCHCFENKFYVKESFLFYLEYQQTTFIGLFCPKTNYGKNTNF